jgi:hypothetical protein
MVRRLSPLLVFAACLSACGAYGVASAQDRPGLYLDPQQLPPGTEPGECVTRRVTGPGGAYRWERIECAGHAGWSDIDHRQALRVQEGPQGGVLRGDRYGGWSQGGPPDGRGYDRQDDEGRYDGGYRLYRVAGRDADGFLVWPGKLP